MCMNGSVGRRRTSSHCHHYYNADDDHDDLPIYLLIISCYCYQVDSVGEGRAYEVHVVVLLEKTKIR